MSYSCSDIQEILSAQLDGETTLVEEEVASLHLVECAPCRAFSEQLEELSFALLKESEPPVPPIMGEMALPVRVMVSGPLRVLDAKLWLLLLVPTLTTNFQLATLLTQNSGGSLAPLLPLSLFFVVTPLLALGRKTTPWSRLRVVGALAMLAPLTSLAGGLALLLLMVLAARSPRPPDTPRQAHLALGLLTVIGVEALLRWHDLLETFLTVATRFAGPEQAWLGQAALASLCAWLWSLATSRRQWLEAGFLAAALLSLGLFLTPLASAYQTHLGMLRALPEPRSQRWWMCFGGHLYTVEASTSHWERWRTMGPATEWSPTSKVRLKGQLESGSFDLLPGRAMAAIPYPETLLGEPRDVPPARLRQTVRAHLAGLDDAVEARLRPDLQGFLLFHSSPLALSQALFNRQERFQMMVKPGDYAMAVELGELESRGSGADWNRVRVKGPTDLGLDSYWPNLVWKRPRNLDFAAGLKDWYDNGEGRVIPGGVEIATPPFWPRSQGVGQKFRPLSVGGPSVDEVRVTVVLFEPTPHAQIRLDSYSHDTDRVMLEVPWKGGTRITASMPVSDDLAYVEMRCEFASLGPPLRIRGFTVEGLAGGKVLESVGLPKP